MIGPAALTALPTDNVFVRNEEVTATAFRAFDSTAVFNDRERTITFIISTGNISFQ